MFLSNQTYAQCGLAAEGGSHTAPVGCNTVTLNLGSGAYHDITVEANTVYSFTWNNNGASDISGFCATSQGGGSGVNFTANQTAWNSGSTTTLRVSSNRLNSSWSGTSGIMTYGRVTPTLAANSPTSASICPSGTTAIAGGAVTNGTRYWQANQSGGTNTSSSGASYNANAAGSWYYRPKNGDCWGAEQATTVTLTPNNTASAGSSTPSLCVNTLLTNITHTTAGATGIGAPTNLPAGVGASFSGNTITISGTPTNTGTFNYSIPLTGGCGMISATGTIIVSANNTAGLASSTPTLCVNTALTNITHATTGATGIGAPSNLPAGVNASFSGNTIIISGTPTNTGTFNYSIPLTGGCGSANAIGVITVTPNNTASVASSTPTVCVNTALTNITHSTSGATGIGTITGLPSGVSASWSGDLITISGTPTVDGTFNYSIELTGGCGAVDAIGTITVTDMVTPSVTITETSVGPYCAGGNVTFASTVAHGGNTVYDWLVNGTSSGQVGSSFASDSLTDADVVSLAIISDAFCATTANAVSQNITVNLTDSVTPSVTITETSVGPYCVGASVTFSSTVANGGNTVYDWLVNGTSSGQVGSSFASDSLTDADVVSLAIVSDAFCATTANAVSQNITVNLTDSVTPSVTITETSVGPYCVGAGVTFSSTVANGGNTVYDWLVNGTSSGQTGNTFSSTSLNNGDEVSLAIVSDAFCATTTNVVSQDVAVNLTSPVTPTVTITKTSTGVHCAGTNVTFSSSVTNGGNTVYSWLVNGVASGQTGNSFSSTSLNDGDIVSLSIISDIFCATPASVTSNAITVNINTSGTPAQPSVITGSAAVCSGNTATYSVVAATGVTYTWTLPAGWVGSSNTNSITVTSGTSGGVISVIANGPCGNSVARTITVSSLSQTQSTTINACAPYVLNGVTYNVDGTFRDTLVNSQGCDSIVVIHVTTVTPAVTQNGNTLTAVQLGASYRWLNCANNSLVSGADQRNFTPSQSGNYALAVNRNGCKDTSACVNVSFISIEEAGAAGGVLIYPNPTSDYVNIELSQLAGESDIHIIDMVGRTVFRKNISAGDSHVETIETTRFNVGTYYIQIVRDGKSVAGGRIVITR